MSNIVFIGELPPPYGGVAVKDKLVYQEVYRELGTEMIDLVECKRQPLKIPVIFLKIVIRMVKRKKIIIGVGTLKRRKILLQMQKLFGGKDSLKNIVLLGMGGRIHEVDAEDTRMRQLMQKIGSVWVETEGMISRMKALGIEQTFLFPNCRTDEGSIPPIDCKSRNLKLVYFSRICPEKGVDTIINTVKNLPKDCTLDFYGEIADEFRDTFDAFLIDNPNVNYHGVFDSTKGNVYKELNQYDVMLLPSRWKGEGVPGALVESKMAGITAIVSNWNFNSEVIIDGKEGIVLENGSEDELQEAISGLCANRNIVMEMKMGAYLSRSRYDIASYKKQLQNSVM